MPKKKTTKKTTKKSMTSFGEPLISPPETPPKINGNEDWSRTLYLRDLSPGCPELVVSVSLVPCLEGVTYVARLWLPFEQGSARRQFKKTRAEMVVQALEGLEILGEEVSTSWGDGEWLMSKAREDPWMRHRAYPSEGVLEAPSINAALTDVEKFFLKELEFFEGRMQKLAKTTHAFLEEEVVGAYDTPYPFQEDDEVEDDEDD